MTTLGATLSNVDVPTLTGGLVPIAQIPTGTSGTQVCAGNDSRLSDAILWC